MGDEKVYLNGRIVPAGEATVSVSDAGFLHGASVFTTMLAHRGKVFRLGRHLERLRSTAELLGLRVGVDEAALSAAVYDVLAANALTEARMRITLTPGAIQGGEPTTVVTASPLPEYPPEWYTHGIAVCVSSFRQGWGTPEYGHKTGCYLSRVLARQEAAAKRAEEALWLTGDNRLAEACFSNVFCVWNGEVVTPPTDTPALPGVVRQAVLELCGQLDLPCRDDAPVTVRQMLDAAEMFLTSSCSGIRPVVRVEGRDVGDGRPGPVTARLMAAYRELLDRECAP